MVSNVMTAIWLLRAACADRARPACRVSRPARTGTSAARGGTIVDAARERPGGARSHLGRARGRLRRLGLDLPLHPDREPDAPRVRDVVAALLDRGRPALRLVDPARRHGRRPARAAEKWAAATVVGAALFLVGNAGVAWAEKRVDTGVASLIIAAVPLWMALFDRVACGQRLSRDSGDRARPRLRRRRAARVADRAEPHRRRGGDRTPRRGRRLGGGLALLASRAAPAAAVRQRAACRCSPAACCSRSSPRRPAR